MRPIAPEILEKINQTIQTRDNNSSFHNYIWIKRPTTELLDGQYIEGPLNIDEENDILDFDLAVCHPIRHHDDTSLWHCHITDGTTNTIDISEYTLKTKMDDGLLRTVYTDPFGYSSEPIACAIAFDGTMPKSDDGTVEFITEQYPWVFCVYDDGKLLAKQINTNRIEDVLAENNCTDVSAVRAMQSSYGGFDFGLVCFFILSGSIYYRQRIGGVWMDAAPVSGLPDNMTWIEIAAFHTWDYRVGFHAKNSDGEVYELFTQYMGIGKQNSEHIRATVSAEGKQTKVDYSNYNDGDEHIEAYVSSEASLLYAWAAVPISATNEEVNGDWGQRIRVQMSHPQSKVEHIADSLFLLTDSDGLSYTCLGVGYGNTEHTELIADFTDFNSSWSASNMTFTYTAPESNGLQSPAVPTESFSISFTPIHLEKPDIDPPTIVSLWNGDEEDLQNGEKIIIEFSEELIGGVSESLGAFSVSFPEYLYEPEGSLGSSTRTPIKIEQRDAKTIALIFAPGSKNSIQNSDGDVTVHYRNGRLRGLGGPVQNFEESFTPIGLEDKSDRADIEHIEASVSASGSLMRVYYSDYKNGDEHIEVSVSASGVLTHVDDL